VAISIENYKQASTPALEAALDALADVDGEDAGGLALSIELELAERKRGAK
jgi:hypothetical protein